MGVGLDIVDHVLGVFHCFITEKAVKLHLFQIRFMVEELCYCGVTEVFGDMRVVGLVISPIVVITVVAVSVVIVMSIVIVCTVVTGMSSTSRKLIFMLMVIVALFDMVWSMMLRNMMGWLIHRMFLVVHVPAVMVVRVSPIVGIHFMLVRRIHLMVLKSWVIDVMIQMRNHTIWVIVVVIIGAIVTLVMMLVVWFIMVIVISIMSLVWMFIVV